MVSFILVSSIKDLENGFRSLILFNLIAFLFYFFDPPENWNWAKQPEIVEYLTNGPWNEAALKMAVLMA